MKLFIISFSFSILVIFSMSAKIGKADNNKNPQNILKIIAGGILKDASFKFVDKNTGGKYLSAAEAHDSAKLQIDSRYNDWRYWNGIINIAMIRLGKVLNNSDYSKFAIKNIAFSFDNYQYFKDKYNNEDKWSYPFAQRFIMEELDDYGAMGAGVIEVYQLDHQERYKNYIDQAASYITRRQYRLKDGTFVRSFPRKYTLWADDLYMSISFLSRLGELTGKMQYFDDAAKQVINFHKYLFDKERGLMYHNWYSDTGQNGIAFWGRANGWAMLAQVDLLDRLPDGYPLRDTLITLLRKHILGISKYQSGNGLWHQLLDKPDSYLETSCSAMFTYSIARAVNKGYIDPGFASIAIKGWDGVKSEILPDGQVEGVCTGTVVSDDLTSYYNRPAPLNDVHGIGTVLLAGIEVLQLNK
jgi:unsaturated rhamnogalacturonyl hydrolase